MNIKKRLLAPACVFLLFQAGCLTPLDVQNIAQGQFISFVNALINTVTSDAIRSVFSG